MDKIKIYVEIHARNELVKHKNIVNTHLDICKSYADNVCYNWFDEICKYELGYTSAHIASLSSHNFLHTIK